MTEGDASLDRSFNRASGAAWPRSRSRWPLECGGIGSGEIEERERERERGEGERERERERERSEEREREEERERSWIKEAISSVIIYLSALPEEGRRRQRGVLRRELRFQLLQLGGIELQKRRNRFFFALCQIGLLFPLPGYGERRRPQSPPWSPFRAL